MTLARDLVETGMQSEYLAFADLLRSLSAEEWERPTRCSGWRVADVAGHVVGQLNDVVNLRLDGLGSAEATQREVDERRGRSPVELAEELEADVKTATDLAASFDEAAWNGPLPGGTGTLGTGVEALWFDTYVHADDIRAGVGRPSEPGQGTLASLSHIAEELTELGFEPAVLRFAGYPEFPVSGGGSRVIDGDAFAFVLAATGRTDPAELGLEPAVNIYR